MLIIDENCAKRIEEVRQFAREQGLTENFEEGLRYLNGYACNERFDACRIELWPITWNPVSFEFQMYYKKRDETEYKPWMNGGLIYFGPRDGEEVNPERHGWSTHT
jgi:hypothetical protein